MLAKFKNPKNDYIEEVGSKRSWLWVLLLGPLYWLVRGVWRHAVLHFILGGGIFPLLLLSSLLLLLFSGAQYYAVANLHEYVSLLLLLFSGAQYLGFITLVIILATPSIIYSFLTYQILRKHYLRMGWEEVKETEALKAEALKAEAG